MFIAIVLWIVAFAFVLVTSINMIRRAIKTKHCTAEANADVVEIKELVRRRNGIITREYLPTISYVVDGTTYTRKYTKAYHSDTYHIGQILPILYNPQKPDDVNTIGTSNKADLVMLIIGLVIGVAGIFFVMLQK